MTTTDDLRDELQKIRESIKELTGLVREVVLGNLTFRVEVGKPNEDPPFTE
jgi:hypothetical protein